MGRAGPRRRRREGDALPPPERGSPRAVSTTTSKRLPLVTQRILVSSHGGNWTCMPREGSCSRVRHHEYLVDGQLECRPPAEIRDEHLEQIPAVVRFVGSHGCDEVLGSPRGCTECRRRHVGIAVMVGTAITPKRAVLIRRPRGASSVAMFRADQDRVGQWSARAPGRPQGSCCREKLPLLRGLPSAMTWRSCGPA